MTDPTGKRHDPAERLVEEARAETVRRVLAGQQVAPGAWWVDR